MKHPIILLGERPQLDPDRDRAHNDEAAGGLPGGPRPLRRRRARLLLPPARLPALRARLPLHRRRPARRHRQPEGGRKVGREAAAAHGGGRQVPNEGILHSGDL